MSSRSPLRSRNNDVPSYVSFFNRTNRTVNLFWVDYQGKLLRYGRLPPFKGTAMNTYVTHPWIVRDARTGYPMLMNGKPVFHPSENAQDGPARTLVWIHIPVFSLLRRSLEVIFTHFDRETVMQWDMPATLKELLAKIAPITEFGNYRFFEDVTYYDLQQLGFQADWFDDDPDSEEEGNEADNEDNLDSSGDSDDDRDSDDDGGDDDDYIEIHGHGNAEANVNVIDENGEIGNVEDIGDNAGESDAKDNRNDPRIDRDKSDGGDGSE